MIGVKDMSYFQMRFGSSKQYGYPKTLVQARQGAYRYCKKEGFRSTCEIYEITKKGEKYIGQAVGFRNGTVGWSFWPNGTIYRLYSNGRIKKEND